MGLKNAATADDIMAPAEMKGILARAKRGDPASAVIGLTKEKDGVILLDKRKKPKQLFAILKKEAADAGLALEMPSLRFGIATVDPDDTTMVTFTVNKEASGAMRPKLIVLLKKAGFSKVEIVVDEGLETQEEEQDSENGDLAAPAKPAAAPGAEAPAAGAAEQAAGPGPDMGPFTQQLAGLMKQIPSVIAMAADQKDALVGLATQANAAIKAADPTAATAAITSLNQAMAAAGAAAGSAAGAAAPGATPGGASKAALSKLDTTGNAWRATRAAVEKQLDSLHGKMADAYKDHGFGPDLEKFFKAKVEPVLGNLDDSLLHVLADVGKATDAGEQKKLVVQAQQIVTKYESYLAGEPLIKQLDDNPFMPLQIGATLTKTLAALNTTLGTIAGSMAA